jgi:WD40 repeat protein/serine/threonine protein kinase
VTGLPDQISRYRVRAVLGVGGFGTVVSALDETLDAQVAIKVLATEHSTNPATRERFVREARLLRRVRSAHVIAIHDIGELDDGRPYLVMELANGGVLADRIVPGQSVDAQGVGATINALAAGLGALHTAGIIHRDIKPANLLIIDDSLAGDGSVTVQRLGLLARSERIVVGDLGLAMDQERTAAGPTIVGGTPFFRSPEQTRHGEVIGPPADIYGATGVIWNLLTGETPGGEAAFEAQLATTPPAWRSFFARGLALEPESRFATMEEWEGAALEAIERDSGMREVGFRAVAAGATCPYKGLTSYQPEDAAFFFGRESLVDELISRLQSSRTLVIGGPSGSGKSSLLRAGLVPAIGGGSLPGSQHWPILLFVPGADPVEELAYQLARLAPDVPPLDGDALRQDPRAARRWLPSGTAGLLAIDQFEELFTQPSDRSDCRAFLDVLAVVTTAQDLQIRVVMGLRSDFYSTAAEYPWLAECISDNQMLVGPMRRHELRRAIELPAQRAGLRLEPGLTDAVLDESGDEAGTLPLVAHALMETWRRRRGTVLTLEGFHNAGGVVGGIAQSAENAYNQLDGPSRVVARRLLLRLVSPGEDAPDTRRRLTWEELEADSQTTEVVETLATERLLTVDDRGVELVHETLIQAWPRLREWIDENRDDLRMQQRVTRAAAEWEAQQRDPDLLYRGAPLAAVLDWYQHADVGLPEPAAAFVEAGRAARDAEEIERRSVERRRRSARRIAFGVLSILTVAAVVASLVAFGALRQSRHNESEAENRLAHGLATQAESLASTQPKLALALAAESGARLDQMPSEAQRAMVTARLAMATSKIVPNGEPIPVGDVLTVVLTPDGSTTVTGSRDGTVRLWDTQTGEVTAMLTGPTKGIEEAAIDPGGRWLVAAGADGLWRWDLDTKAPGGEVVDRPTGALWSVAFSADGRQLATAAEDGVVQVYDTTAWRRDGDAYTADVDFLSVAFTPDGKRLFAGTGDGRLFSWDLDRREAIGTSLLVHGTNDVWELAVDPSGQRIATASSDGTARVWSLESGALVASPFVNPDGSPALGDVRGLVWSSDGGSLLASGADGHVHEWDLVNGTEVDVSAIGHDDSVVDAAASADGDILVTLGRDQDVRVWDLGDRQAAVAPVASLDGELYGVALSNDGATIAASDSNGAIHLILPGRDQRELSGHTGRVLGLAFLSDGRLVSGGDDGALRVWDTETGRSVEIREGASPDAITSLSVPSDGDRIASSSADGVVRVWSVDGLEPIAETPRQPVSANKVVYGPSGALVAAYNDGLVRFWTRDGKEARSPLQVDDDRDAVFSVAISPDGRMLAAASATDGVTLRSLDTAAPASGLNGQPIDPVDVAFTPDGAALASATRDGVVTLWNSTTGESIGPRFDYHSDAVWRLAVSPSSAVLSASEDGTISKLDVLNMGRACELAGGALDRRARDRYLGGRQPVGCKER